MTNHAKLICALNNLTGSNAKLIVTVLRTARHPAIIKQARRVAGHLIRAAVRFERTTVR